MDLEAARRRIDEVDRKIVALLNERAQVALQIGAIKGREGKAVLDPKRETLVLERVVSASEGPLPPDYIRAIYREVISACRQLQEPLRVAFLGPVATFTHQAARMKFGASAEFVAARNVAEVFDLAEKGHADLGVVPVENSNEGFVGNTLDLLADTELRICGEISLPIIQCLVSKYALDEIRIVYSHPQALAQSRNWLQQYLPSADLVEVSSTSRAAEMAAERTHAAAIGSELTAEAYGLNIIKKGTQDENDNVTRFFVIGKDMGKRTGADKTLVMFTIKDRVGALHDVLAVLLRHSINMTKIESRPSKQKVWDYVFFIEIEGHPDDEPVSRAIAQLSEMCAYVKPLGSWMAC